MPETDKLAKYRAAIAESETVAKPTAGSGFRPGPGLKAAGATASRLVDEALKAAAGAKDMVLEPPPSEPEPQPAPEPEPPAGLDPLAQCPCCGWLLARNPFAQVDDDVKIAFVSSRHGARFSMTFKWCGTGYVRFAALRPAEARWLSKAAQALGTGKGWSLSDCDEWLGRARCWSQVCERRLPNDREPVSLFLALAPDLARGVAASDCLLPEPLGAPTADAAERLMAALDEAHEPLAVDEPAAMALAALGQRFSFMSFVLASKTPEDEGNDPFWRPTSGPSP